MEREKMDKVTDFQLRNIMKQYPKGSVIASMAEELLNTKAELLAARKALAWVPVEERLPEVRRDVLAIIERENGLSHVEKVCYIPPKTILSEEFLDGDYAESVEEYDEEIDNFWVVEGWWEASNEASINWKISGTVICWLDIPPLPQPQGGE
jgi:hypothetical protein